MCPCQPCHRHRAERTNPRGIGRFRGGGSGNPLAWLLAAPHGGHEENAMDENEHPRGALVLMLVYLLLLASLWTHMYLKLWRG